MENLDDLFAPKQDEIDEDVIANNGGNNIDDYLSSKYNVGNADDVDDNDDNNDDNDNNNDNDDVDNNDGNDGGNNDNNGGNNNDGDDNNGGDDNNDGNDDNADTVYSIIAQELQKAGIIGDSEVKSLDQLNEAINKQIDAKIKEKLALGEVSDNTDPQFKEYKTNSDILSKLKQIKQDNIAYSPDEKYKNLKTNIVAQYLKLSGCPDKLATKMLESMAGNQDELNEQCKDAIEFTLDYYSKENDRLIDLLNNKKSQKEADELKKQQDLMTALNDENDKFKLFNVSSRERKKAIRLISEKNCKDANGNQITEIEKYIQDNPIEYKKNITLFYALTNGFKDFAQLSKIASKKNIESTTQKLNELLRNGGSKQSSQRRNDNDWPF